MELLPKTQDDFSKTGYWDNFFKKRGSKKFEWYGEFMDLCEILNKYIKCQDSILMAGCGNSMLSADLFDVGYRKITNVDISSVVINQMKSKVGRKRPEMTFEEMDILNMSYENEKFMVVIDKGTLDALMPNNSEIDKARAVKFFSEVDRVLKVNGRYIIISLLQEHILSEILNFFTKAGWMIRIIRCMDVEKRNIAETGRLTMPVFVVICVKFKNVASTQSIMEVNAFINGKSERMKSKEEVMTVIKGIQDTVFHFMKAKGEIEIKFCRNEEDLPRYIIYIVDGSEDQRKLLKYAAFIVPHGRETEWMFGSSDGRSYLRQSSGFDRLAVITFHRYQNYGSMQEVQDELRQTVLQLAPSLMPFSSDSPNIPYLTLSDGVGHREIIYTGTSKYSGDLLVEDVEIENEIFRRLIFMNNQSVLQSEARMKNGPSTNTSINNKSKIVDSSYVASSHILYMSIPVALQSFETSSLLIAVIGVGGGGLCQLLHTVYPDVSVTGVELDPLVVELAKKYFDLKEDARLKVIVKDGLEFLQEKQKFHIIMFDIDSKETGSALSCPPPQFIEPDILSIVAKSLGDKGVFVTNVVSRVDSELDNLIKTIEQHFSLVGWYNLKEDVNRIVYASNIKGKSKIQWQNDLKEAALIFDKALEKELKLGKEAMNLNHLMDNLMI